MKRAVVLLVVLAGVVAGTVFFWPRAAVEPPAVLRAAVTRGPITETVKAYGTLEPLRRVNVGSQVSGTVKAIYADFNSVVTQGQVLAEIDTSLLETQVKIQEANVERQKADIASQEVVLDDLRRQFARATELHDRGLQNDQQYEAAALALKTRESQVASAKKQLVQAEANLAAARLNVTYATIRSPIDGVVIQRRVDRGQTVQASTTTPSFFMLVTPLQVLKLSAGVSEADIGRVRPGMEVEFRVGTYGSELFRGTVEAVRLNAWRNSEVVTYPVWIHVPNDDLRLRVSMTAEVFIHVSQLPDVVRIPNDALRFRPTRAVYAALGLEAPPVETVRASDRAGDRVVDPNALRTLKLDHEPDSIDELFSPPPKADSRATVWRWDETLKTFTAIPVRIGVTDGTTSELLEGDVKVGDELVTGLDLPMAPTQPAPAQNPLLSPPRRGR